jgi:hypothetical protein
MNRGTVRSVGIDAALGSGLGREARFAKPGPDSIKRGTVRTDGMDAASVSGPGQEARFAKPGSNSMKRGTVRSDGMDGAVVAALVPIWRQPLPPTPSLKGRGSK